MTLAGENCSEVRITADIAPSSMVKADTPALREFQSKLSAVMKNAPDECSSDTGYDVFLKTIYVGILHSYSSLLLHDYITIHGER